MQVSWWAFNTISALIFLFQTLLLSFKYWCRNALGLWLETWAILAASKLTPKCRSTSSRWPSRWTRGGSPNGSRERCIRGPRWGAWPTSRRRPGRCTRDLRIERCASNIGFDEMFDWPSSGSQDTRCFGTGMAGESCRVWIKALKSYYTGF